MSSNKLLLKRSLAPEDWKFKSCVKILVTKFLNPCYFSTSYQIFIIFIFFKALIKWSLIVEFSLSKSR